MEQLRTQETCKSVGGSDSKPGAKDTNHDDQGVVTDKHQGETCDGREAEKDEERVFRTYSTLD